MDTRTSCCWMLHLGKNRKIDGHKPRPERRSERADDKCGITNSRLRPGRKMPDNPASFTKMIKKNPLYFTATPYLRSKNTCSLDERQFYVTLQSFFVVWINFAYDLPDWACPEQRVTTRRDRVKHLFAWQGFGIKTPPPYFRFRFIVSSR